MSTYPNRKSCGHDAYWTGNYGTCMACRAEKAEAALAEARGQAEKFANGMINLRKENAAQASQIELHEKAGESAARQYAAMAIQIAALSEQVGKARETLIRLMSKIQIQHGTDMLGEAWDSAVDFISPAQPIEGAKPCEDGEHSFTLPFGPGSRCNNCGWNGLGTPAKPEGAEGGV